MKPRPRRHRSGLRRTAGRTAGFTLIELTIVIFVISLMFGVVFPYVGQKTEINLRAEARALGGAIRFSSGEAVFRRRPTRLYFDFAKNKYWVAILGDDGFFPMTSPLGKLHAPMSGVYLQSVWVGGAEFNKGIAFVQFDPDGGMEEAVINIGNDTGDITSLVPDPNTGAATIIPGGGDPRILFPDNASFRALGPRGPE